MSGKFSPSKSHRWLVCHASVDFDSDGPESIYAEEGSHAHAILEQILKDIPVLTGDIVMSKPAPAIRIQQSIEIRDFIRQWHRQHPDFVMESESPIAVSKAIGFSDRPEDFDGTADAVAWNYKEALVLDAKFGFVRVEPKNNSQLYLYAMGLLNELQMMHGQPYPMDFPITVIIAQPDYEGVVQFREHRMTFYELRNWWDSIAGTLTSVARDNDRTFNASDENACRFCPARTTCRARLDKLMDFAKEEWRMTKTLGELLPTLSQIRHIADDLEALAVKQLSEGMTVPGYKLVESRSIRKWGADRTTLELAASREDITIVETKLLSPAKIEQKYRLKGKEFTKQFAVIPRGAPKLAPEADPRPVYKPEDFTQEEIDSLLEDE